MCMPTTFLPILTFFPGLRPFFIQWIPVSSICMVNTVLTSAVVGLSFVSLLITLLQSFMSVLTSFVLCVSYFSSKSLAI